MTERLVGVCFVPADYGYPTLSGLREKKKKVKKETINRATKFCYSLTLNPKLQALSVYTKRKSSWGGGTASPTLPMPPQSQRPKVQRLADSCRVAASSCPISLRRRLRCWQRFSAEPGSASSNRLDNSPSVMS